MLRRKLGFVAAFLPLLLAAKPHDVSEVPSARAEFVTELNGDASPFKVRSVFLLPGSLLDGNVPDGGEVKADAGTVTSNGNSWHWKAPSKPGHYFLRIHRGEEEVVINAFVMVPYAQ